MRRTLRAATLAPLAVLALTATGCAVNNLGLDPEGGIDSPPPPVDATVDRPSDLAPAVDAGRDGPGGDVVCGTCDTAASFITLPGGRFIGSTAGTSAAQGSCGGADAAEAVFKIVLAATSDLFVTTHGTGFDTVLYLRRESCCEEIACNDDADGRATSVLAQRALAPGTYFIYVDGASPGDHGDFTLDVYATPAADADAEACGNPTRISANPIAGTTCSSHDDYSPPGGCSSAVSGPNGLDQVFYFVLDAPGEVTFSTCDDTCIDTVLYLREVCSDPGSVPANGCDDDACRASGSCQLTGNQVQSRVSTTLGAGVHYLVLDTFAAVSQAPCGKFTITPTGVP